MMKCGICAFIPSLHVNQVAPTIVMPKHVQAVMTNSLGTISLNNETATVRPPATSAIPSNFRCFTSRMVSSKKVIITISFSSGEIVFISPLAVNTKPSKPSMT